MRDLFAGAAPAKSGTVECLGQMFQSDEARREHYLKLLAEKLKDPEFRKIEGFPVGSDDAILAMSDPPYYTACPNPWLAEFVAQYGKPYLPSTSGAGGEGEYHREPLAIDVSVGKTDPLYKAHSYHTKVPHLAIVPSILHYTEPGDIVLDGFGGSGMTGVAAQWCGSAPDAYRHSLEMEWKKQGKAVPRWGARRVVLNDLSPAATFIGANYNIAFDVEAFARAGKKLLQEVEQEIGWMYQTLHVEPASSRLKQLTGFVETNPKQQHANGSTTEAGITSFTKRQDCLPHWQLPGSVYFLTFNTYNRRILTPEARKIVLDALVFFDGQRLTFIAAVVMPDHVHAVIRPLEKQAGGYWDLSDLMHSIKSYSANQINRIENTVGTTVWQTETYDRIIRDGLEYGFTLQYIAYNPVVAGLSGKPQEYPWFLVGKGVEAAGWKPAPQLGRIEYTVWSEVFSCPECAGTVNFLAEALEDESKRVREVFPCPHCGAELNKDRLERVLETRTDPATGQAWQRVKFTPSIISYMVGKTRYEKTPDEADLATLAKIEALPLPASMPTSRFPIEDMYHGSRIAPKGLTHIHHFYLPRAAQAMGLLWEKSIVGPASSRPGIPGKSGQQDAGPTDNRTRHMLLFMVEQAIWGLSVLNRYGPTHFSQVNRMLNGVYYVASQHAECSPWYNLGGKLARLVKAFPVGPASSRPDIPDRPDFSGKSGQQDAGSTVNTIISTGTAARLALADNSIDYIFTDPPFGENIYYADLNFLVESWHRVTTDAKAEAIVDKFKKKALPEYQHLMQRCFTEYYRVLKPGRWMTVVFSNSKAAVWNTIQVALQQAGFVVAEVTALDKVQGSYRQVTSATAVKQDLVISAYKPNGGLEERFRNSGVTAESAWDFVQTHLRQLSVTRIKNGELEFVAERAPHILFDRMVAWFVRHNAPVPISSQEFQAGLRTRFPDRDGMVFLPGQVIEYDKKRTQTTQAPQMELFVSDERSAIDWLTDFLKRRPSTYPEIHPEYLPTIGLAKKKGEIIPELSALLDDNFLRYDGAGEVPSQIHAYLSSNWPDLRNLDKSDSRLVAKAKDRWYVPDPNKAQDLEKKRDKALLKEFDHYRAFTGRRLKEFRLEALRAGFRAAWGNKDYQTIIDIAKKLPDEALQEDEKLLTLYDMALTRTEEN